MVPRDTAHGPRRKPNTRSILPKKKHLTQTGLGDVNFPYYDDFRQHVEDVLDHLAGRTTEEEEESDGTDGPENPLSHPHWTPEEKDAFFHALTTSSRLRPDLISACIQTKSVFEVCQYIQTLDEALEDLNAAEIESEEEASSSDDDEDEHANSDDNLDSPAQTGRKRKRHPSERETQAQKRARKRLERESLALQRRALHPTAHEVSEEWVEVEDDLSRALCALDDVQDIVGRIDHPPCSSSSPKNASSIPGVSANANVTDGDGREKNVSTHFQGLAEDEREPIEVTGAGKEVEEGRVQSEEHQSPAWKTQNLHLMPEQLHILARIVREGEDNASYVDSSTALSTAGEVAIAPGSCVSPDAQVPPSMVGPAPTGVPEEPQEDKDEDEDAANVDLSKMTAAARRRFKKRLYMRKQRALKRGVALEEVDTTSLRLKRGRPRKQFEVDDQEIEPEAERENAEEEGYAWRPVSAGEHADDEEEGDATVRRDFLAELEHAHIDARTLEEERLSFFNLPGVGRLLKCVLSYS